jgi:hypothetical protein
MRERSRTFYPRWLSPIYVTQATKTLHWLTLRRRNDLTAHWIDQIVGLCQDEEDRPAHNTAVDYVRGVAATLSFVARILGAERGLSLNPDDPRGPVERPDEALSSEDAGAMLLWCASAAACVAAKLQPQFKIGSTSPDLAGSRLM